MDISAKRSAAEKVKRRLDRQLSPLGFKRTKPTFWTRPNASTIEFVHLHLYTFAPAFRVHCGVRALDDPFEAIALNGPSSNGVPLNPFEFDASESSHESCASLMAGYVRDQGSWFSEQRTRPRASEFPLPEAAVISIASEQLAPALAEARARTARLLGITG